MNAKMKDQPDRNIIYVDEISALKNHVIFLKLIPLPQTLLYHLCERSRHLKFGFAKLNAPYLYICTIDITAIFRTSPSRT